MKMNIKKKVAMGLVSVMAVSLLAGCGSKDSKKSGKKVDINVKEVMAEMAEAATKIDSFKIDGNASLDAIVEESGMKITVKGDGNAEGQFTLDEPSAHLSGDVSYELGYGGDKISGEHSMEMYGEADGDDFNTYTSLDDGDWTKNVSDLTDFTDSFEEFQSMDMSEVKDALDELKNEDINKFVKLKGETEVVNDKECYVVAAKISKELVQDLIAAGEDTEELDLADLDEELEDFETFDVSYKLYINANTYYPVKMSFVCNMDGGDEDMQVTVNKCNLDINFGINEAKTVETPEDVTDGAVEDGEFKDSLDSIFGSGKLDSDSDEDEDLETDVQERETKLVDISGIKTDNSVVPKTITLEGKQITLPAKVSDFVAAGFTIETENSEKEDLQPDEYSSIFIYKKSTGGTYLKIRNQTDTAMKPEDCEVYGFNFNNYDEDIDLTLSNGVKLGDDISIVDTLYKDVEGDEYQAYNETSVNYYDDDYNEITYMFESDTNKISSIILQLY